MTALSPMNYNLFSHKPYDYVDQHVCIFFSKRVRINIVKQRALASSCLSVCLPVRFYHLIITFREIFVEDFYINPSKRSIFAKSWAENLSTLHEDLSIFILLTAVQKICGLTQRNREILFHFQIQFQLLCVVDNEAWLNNISETHCCVLMPTDFRWMRHRFALSIFCLLFLGRCY